MITDRMERIGRYAGVLPHAAEIARLFREGKPESEAAPLEVRDKRYETKADEKRQFEVHAHTIYLMIGLEGEEIIHICPQEELEAGAALPGGADGMKMRGAPRGSAVILRPGCFVAIYPGEAHMVAGRVGDGAQAVHKWVVKLPVEDTCPCTSRCERHGICAECVVWHRNPKNSLPFCLRKKGEILIEREISRRAQTEGGKGEDGEKKEADSCS